MLALARREALGEVFNISTGELSIVNKLAETLQKIMGKEFLNPVHVESRPEDKKHSYGDITKARRNLGYEPKVQLEKRLSEPVKSYSKQ